MLSIADIMVFVYQYPCIQDTHVTFDECVSQFADAWIYPEKQHSSEVLSDLKDYMSYQECAR